MSSPSTQPRESLWRELRPGEILRDATGRGFRIVRFLAEGGYSQVYEAEHAVDTADHPRVAIKVLHLKHAKNKKTLRRQMREAETLYELRHPNVVRVHTIGVREDTGMVFMVMDLLVGRTLRDLVRDLGGRMPIPWTLEIMIAVSRGLSAIHRKAVHRDLKPENVHVRDDGHVSLFDLGTSRFQKEDRLTTQGYTIGTLNYMSPEQLSGAEELDGRSDLFAIGTMLYELLSGENPFAGKDRKRDRQEIGNRIMFRPHIPLAELTEAGESAPDLVAKNVPEYLAALVERLLRKKPGDRYASAAIVADLLAAALAKFTLDNREYPALPIATLGDVPRTPEPEEPEEPAIAPSVPTSTNPFLSISFPPDEVTRKTGTAARALSLAYASTEQVAVYPLPATSPAILVRVSAEEIALDELDEVHAADEPVMRAAFESVAKLDREPVGEPGPDSVYMDPDALDTSTLTPHAKRLQHARSLPTERVRVRSGAKVPPIFLYGLGFAAMALAGVFLLGAAGLIGHRPAARPPPSPSGSVAPVAPVATTAPVALPAPAPSAVPSAALEVPRTTPALPRSHAVEAKPPARPAPGPTGQPPVKRRVPTNVFD